MGGKDHYLDNAATTAVLPQAAEASMRMMLSCYGNPSSLHSMGFAAKQELEAARGIVARKLGAQPEELIFTGGGTEANNMAVFGAVEARKRMGTRIVTSMVEHDSVRKAMDELETRGFQIIRLKPQADGSVKPEDIECAIDEQTVFVSLMLCNNETGAVLPVQAASRAIKRKKAPALLHMDCVQAFCKMDFSMRRLGVDLASISGHKVHGPKGVGALYIRKGTRINPLVFGGGQERGMRPGTENLPAIAGFARAVEMAPAPREILPDIRALKEKLLEKLKKFPDVVLNSPEDGLPYIVSFSVRGFRAETMLHFLAQRGVYVSAGSACGKARPSHVLTAMELSGERVASALRVSFSRFTTEEDVQALAEGVKEGIQSLARDK